MGPIIPKWFAVMYLTGYIAKRIITSPFFWIAVVSAVMLYWRYKS